MAGHHKTSRHHTDGCRMRFYTSFYESRDPKWKTIEKNLEATKSDENVEKDREKEDLEIDMDMFCDEPYGPEVDVPRTPTAEPEQPLRNSEHFQPSPELSEIVAEDQMDAGDDPFEGFPDLLWDPDDQKDVDMDQDADAMVKLMVSNNVDELSLIHI